MIKAWSTTAICFLLILLISVGAQDVLAGYSGSMMMPLMNIHPLVQSSLNLVSGIDMKIFGGPLDDRVVGFIKTMDGGYAITATTYSFGNGNADFWLIKLDADGNMEWDQTYGSTGCDTAVALTQAIDGGYVLAGETDLSGQGNSDFLVIKTDPFGREEWNKTYGQATKEIATSMVRTNDGGFAWVGYTIENGTKSNASLYKINSIGNLLWNKTYDGPEGGVAYSMIQTSDLGFALAGTAVSPLNNKQVDFWFAKTDSDGKLDWSRTYSLQETDVAMSLIQTADRQYILAGYTTRGIVDIPHLWVINVDSEGFAKWNSSWAPLEPTFPDKVIQTKEGGYAVSGWTSSLKGFNNLSSYMFLTKFDVDGKIQWNTTYEGLGDSNTLFAEQKENGGYVMAGATRYNSSAYYDVWFAQDLLYPTPSLQSGSPSPTPSSSPTALPVQSPTPSQSLTVSPSVPELTPVTILILAAGVCIVIVTARKKMSLRTTCK